MILSLVAHFLRILLCTSPDVLSVKDTHWYRTWVGPNLDESYPTKQTSVSQTFIASDSFDLHHISLFHLLHPRYSQVHGYRLAGSYEQRHDEEIL